METWQLEFVLQSTMYEKLRKEIMDEMNSENTFIHDYVSLIYL